MAKWKFRKKWLILFRPWETVHYWGSQDRNWRHELLLLTDMLPISYSTCFLVTQKNTNSGIALPTVLWTFLIFLFICFLVYFLFTYFMTCLQFSLPSILQAPLPLPLLLVLYSYYPFISEGFYTNHPLRKWTSSQSDGNISSTDVSSSQITPPCVKLT